VETERKLENRSNGGKPKLVRPGRFQSRQTLRWVLASLLLALTASGAPPTDGAAKAFTPAKPSAATQIQKTSAERGVNPCNSPDPGFGAYEPWNRAPTHGQMLLPKRSRVSVRGDFDVMFHFHGHDPARKEWVRVMDGVVFVGITLGVGSGKYESTFRDRAAFPKLVESVEEAVAKHAGRKKARARRIGLSAWSAGYGAVQEILRHPPSRDRIDSVILLDGMHCGYAQQGSLNKPQIQPFIDFARRAATGNRFMLVSHSSIIPPGYASTTETANFLIHELGGKPSKAKTRKGDPMGLELIARFDRKGFHVRGFSGNDTMDHCAHLGFFRDVLTSYIRPRWQAPAP
jgi:hypothetical protein